MLTPMLSRGIDAGSRLKMKRVHSRASERVRLRRHFGLDNQGGAKGGADSLGGFCMHVVARPPGLRLLYCGAYAKKLRNGPRCVDHWPAVAS